MTRQENFIEIFGLDIWQEMIAFSEVTYQFRDFWTKPYKDKE